MEAHEQVDACDSPGVRCLARRVGLIAVWTQVRVYELLRTWQRIAVDVAIVSGLVMLALLVYAAWDRLRHQK